MFEGLVDVIEVIDDVIDDVIDVILVGNSSALYTLLERYDLPLWVH